jgi:predicted ribosome quality control (RQC) complex YloA/Tae2 family protein
MTLSATELAQVATELGAALAGAHVQKVYVPAVHTAFFDVREPGRSIGLRLEVGADVGHVAVSDARPPSPERPLAVQGLWRLYLTGSRIDAVTATGRTLRLDLSTDQGTRSVVVELDRHGGALVLLDAEERVLGISPPDAVGRSRLQRAQPYVPPEPGHGGTENRLSTTAPDRTTLTVSRAVARLYDDASRTLRVSGARKDLVAALRAARKRLARTVEKVRADRARIDESARYQHYGDLLKPVLGTLKRGVTRARVQDYGAGGVAEVEVPLLPHLSARENMERYYHLYRRMIRSAGRVDDRLAMLSGQLDAADALLRSVEAAGTETEVIALREKALASGLLSESRVLAPSAAASTGPRPPYREFHSASGARIWVGRSAQQNDALTFRWAKGNDLWLHARGQTGSHVVVPGIGDDGPDGELLLDAAELAAHFSAARDEPSAEVAWTRCKYVRKVRDTPGAVTFSQERTIALRREPDRLARLLATERK